MVDMNEPIGLSEPEVTILKGIESELALDVDGVRTLIAEIDKNGRKDLDKAYMWRVIHTVTASLNESIVKLNEVGKSMEEPPVAGIKFPVG